MQYIYDLLYYFKALYEGTATELNAYISLRCWVKEANILHVPNPPLPSQDLSVEYCVMVVEENIHLRNSPVDHVARAILGNGIGSQPRIPLRERGLYS